MYVTNVKLAHPTTYSTSVVVMGTRDARGEHTAILSRLFGGMARLRYNAAVTSRSRNLTAAANNHEHNRCVFPAFPPTKMLVCTSP